MRLLFYSSRQDQVAGWVNEVLEAYLPAGLIDRVCGIDKLEEYFRCRQISASYYLLLVSTMEDLRSLDPYKRFLSDKKCLIGLTGLPDRDISNKAFEFRPRFIAYLPADFERFELVMQKITGMTRNSLGDDATAPRGAIGALDDERPE